MIRKTNNRLQTSAFYCKENSAIIKVLAVVFSLALVCALIPVAAFAEVGKTASEGEDATIQETQQVEATEGFKPATDGEAAIESDDSEVDDEAEIAETLAEIEAASKTEIAAGDLCADVASKGVSTALLGNLANKYDEVDYANADVNYLCFTAKSAGSTVILNVVGTPTQNQGFQISTDKTTWTNYSIGDKITLSSIDDKVYWRAKDGGNTTVCESEETYYQFAMTGKIDASGSIMTLLDQSDNLRTLAGTQYCFYMLFYKCGSLVSVSEDFLPATTLSTQCYHRLFFWCAKLSTSPKLPALALGVHCYHSMFGFCMAITQAPDLPATKMVEGCYEAMFKRCTGLESMPMMGNGSSIAFDQHACCKNMFSFCQNMVVYKTGESANCRLNCSSVSAVHATMNMFCECSTIGDYCSGDDKIKTPTEPFSCYTTNEVTYKTITYNGSGGATESGASEYSLKVVNGAKVYLTANQFVKSGYAFAGWGTTQGATTATYTDEQEVTISDDMDLYAVWTQSKVEPQVSDLTFNAPASLVYDGQVKTASFTGKSGMGAITVSYSEELDGPWEATAPTNVGTYYVMAYVSGGDSYVAKYLVDESWKFTIGQRPVTLTSDSATKVFDCQPLTAKNVTVSAGSFVESEKSLITYENFASITDVGNTQNTFEINWGTVDKNNYATTVNYGTLEVTSAAIPDAKVDTQALKEIKEVYQVKYPGQTITVKMNVSKDNVSSEDIEKIKAAAPNKKLQSYDATLEVKHNGTSEAVSEVKTPIAIEYNFDFTDKSDVQCFRVHNKGAAEELIADKTQTEYVAYDQQAGTVTVTATKYSTYSIAYNEGETPAPTPSPSQESTSVASATSSTGDTTTSSLVALGVLSILAAGCVIYIRRRER